MVVSVSDTKFQEELKIVVGTALLFLVASAFNESVKSTLQPLQRGTTMMWMYTVALMIGTVVILATWAKKS